MTSPSMILSVFINTWFLEVTASHARRKLTWMSSKTWADLGLGDDILSPPSQCQTPSASKVRFTKTIIFFST
ncbi:Protein SVP26 [Fusarium oxysporum f. sp. albedinis]|nr:Protein SVP26 [Fusarium oxysporum f. sp. albedinis]